MTAAVLVSDSKLSPVLRAFQVDSATIAGLAGPFAEAPQKVTRPGKKIGGVQG